MYEVLSTKAFVNTTSGDFSRAVRMEGANSVQVEFTVYSVSGTPTTTTLEVQESNDLENWTTYPSTSYSGTNTVSTSVGCTSFRASSISSQYVRLRWKVSANTAVVGAGINTALL